MHTAKSSSIYPSLTGEAQCRGFTLVELVIVIAITGVMASTLIVFFMPATDAYFDARRRAGLSDAADTALRRMARDVRLAVPNSIRIVGNKCFELLPTSTGGRYRMAADASDSPGCAPSATCSAPLDTSQPSTGFDVLSALNTVPAVGDWVVIGNQNPSDVYSGTNRTKITAVTSPNAQFGAYRFSFTNARFPTGYEGGRFSVVPDNGGAPAVFYVCNGVGMDGNGNGTGTLYRITRDIVAAYPSSCPSSGGAVVATQVSACSFVYNSSTGSTQQNGLVSMMLEVAEAGERVSLSYAAHVDNVP